MSDRNLEGRKPLTHPRKLEVGDKIKVSGWPMLAGLEDGREYRVAYVSYVHGSPYYGFTRKRGKKIIVRHFCRHIDLWIGRTTDLNNIEIIKC